MNKLDRCVLTTAYFPPVEYFYAIAHSSKVLIEACETYQKQSWRTRCDIYAASGRERLSIPVLRECTHKLPIREIKIDYSEDWLHLHKKAISSAYNSSPFFVYYVDDLFPILERKEKFLFDLNTLLLDKLLELTGVRTEVEFTEEFFPEYDEGDFRTVIHPKYRGENLLAAEKKEKTYYQVFSSKHGFISNLSILDLLCHEGPNSISFLY